MIRPRIDNHRIDFIIPYAENKLLAFIIAEGVCPAAGIFVRFLCWRTTPFGFIYCTV